MLRTKTSNIKKNKTHTHRGVSPVHFYDLPLKNKGKTHFGHLHDPTLTAKGPQSFLGSVLFVLQAQTHSSDLNMALRASLASLMW